MKKLTFFLALILLSSLVYAEECYVGQRQSCGPKINGEYSSAGICEIGYQKCVDGSLKEATLSCSSSQTCSEKEQRCVDKEVEDNFIVDDSDGDIIIDEDDIVEKQSFFEQYKTETYIVSSLIVVLIIIGVFLLTGKNGGKRK